MIDAPTHTARIVARRADLGNGPILFCHPEGDDTIYGTLSALSRGLFHLGEIPFVPGDVAIDIGCNVGLVSLALANLPSRPRVFSFDASGLSIGCLRESIDLNGITHIQPIHAAVGAAPGKDVRFYSNGKEHSCLVREGLNSSNPVPDSVVDMVSVDEVFDSPLLGIDRVRYLKMDIEGGEFEIFDHLFEHRSDILDRVEYLHLEVHPYEDRGPARLVERVKARFGSKVFLDS